MYKLQMCTRISHLLLQTNVTFVSLHAQQLPDAVMNVMGTFMHGVIFTQEFPTYSTSVHGYQVAVDLYHISVQTSQTSSEPLNIFVSN